MYTRAQLAVTTLSINKLILKKIGYKIFTSISILFFSHGSMLLFVLLIMFCTNKRKSQLLYNSDKVFPIITSKFTTTRYMQHKNKLKKKPIWRKCTLARKISKEKTQNKKKLNFYLKSNTHFFHFIVEHKSILFFLLLSCLTWLYISKKKVVQYVDLWFRKYCKYCWPKYSLQYNSCQNINTGRKKS